MKIGIIANFGNKEDIFDGQTIKTREINNFIEKHFNLSVDKLNTYKISKKVFKLFYKIRKLLKNNEIIIVMVANRGYKVITPIIMFLNIFYKRKIIEIVIGGTRYKLYKKHKLLLKLSKKYYSILVETNTMKKEYLKFNLNNVQVMPNFKYLEKEKFRKTQGKIKLCTFSRIVKEKGIEESINAVIQSNRLVGKEIFSLDIYGDIDNKYKNDFNYLLKSSPKYIMYKGKAKYYESSKIINNYDLLLFLTYYPNEGFAGTIIDSFFAGVPVITTLWNSNSEIIKNKYNGILVNVKDVSDVVNNLINLYNNTDLIDKMKKNCLKEADKYNAKSATNILVKKIRE